MSTASEELNSFYQFAEWRLQGSGRDETLDDLYAEWRAQNPSPEELDKDVRAVRASLRDLERGEMGRPFNEFAAEFRQRKQLLPSDVIYG
jgi:hypothetical protein